MKIAVTGADQNLGRAFCRQLGKRYDVLGWGQRADAPNLSPEGVYQRVDLCQRERIAEALGGIQAIVHAALFDCPQPGGDQDEAELLDWAARGTYGLVMEAINAGIKRVVIISRLSLMEAYPEDFVVRENWMPQPRPEVAELAPYTAELVGRELARTEPIEVVCLRLGAIGDAAGTSIQDAVEAVVEALEHPPRQSGHRWQLSHVASAGRFAR
ncbi:MAG: NAD-dependent epimerase/dehydratase family protein [Candidatus Latescibacteria bacterium]|nr:NAD-dependent epimerase/dehydratase family protein [Candidatus Latescibacterota bacterium]